MVTTLLALALSVPSSAARPGLIIANLPLPGYSHAPLPAHAAEGAFPSTESLYGESSDPFAAITDVEDDLRDSVAEPPTAALQAALRSASAPQRLAAIRAAGVPRDIEAIPHLTGVLMRLDEPSRMRAAAALALGRIGDEIAIPALTDGLKDPTLEVRYASALSLGRLTADGVATTLEKVLRSDPAWQPRFAAAIALGRSRKAFAAGILAQALSSDPAWQVRQQAARSLQDVGTPHAARALTLALHDPEPSVRAAAGGALAEIGGPAQRRAVVEALRDEREPAVRAILSVAAQRASLRP